MIIDKQGNEVITTFRGDFDSTIESRKIKSAFDAAVSDQHNLNEGIITMEGMSGFAYRKFINNLIKLTDNPRYLEIGVWKGSTTCSAIWDNKCKVTAIDNWSEFGGPKTEFENNFNACKNDNVDFVIMEQDFRTVDYNNLGKHNIYMFDGPHDEQDQYDGIAIAQSALDNTYIQIVDDWNNEWCQRGTRRAFDDLGLKILSEIVITTVSGAPWCQDSPWHNGYFIGLIEKT